MATTFNCPICGEETTTVGVCWGCPGPLDDGPGELPEVDYCGLCGQDWDACMCSDVERDDWRRM